MSGLAKGPGQRLAAGLYLLVLCLAFAPLLAAQITGLSSAGAPAPGSSVSTGSPSPGTSTSADPAVPATPAPADLVCVRARELTDAREPERALELIRSAGSLQGDKKDQICAAEFSQALVAASLAHEARPVPTWFAGLVGDLTAVPEVIGLALGLVLVLALLARLALPWVPWWPTIHPRSSAPAVLFGLVLMADGGATLAVTVTGAGGPGTWAVFWSGAAVALVGTVSLAIGVGTRIRLAIDCTGTEGTADERLLGRVAARIGELGIDPATDIEIPRGTDVQVLEGSTLGSLPEGRVAKLLVGLRDVVLGARPWHVFVDTQADGAYAVSVTRNGRAVASATVSRELIRLSDDDTGKKARDQVDLAVLVAAFVLATLADAYRGFDGLGGATDWLSIGLHAVATTDRELAESHIRELLAQAVDHDPGNWPAHVALRHALWRRSTDAKELEQYVAWLDTAIRRPEVRSKYPSLWLRMCTTRALARVNGYYAEGDAAHSLRAAVLPRASDLADALVDLSESYPHLVAETEETAWSLALMLAPVTACEVITGPGAAGESLASLTQEVLRAVLVDPGREVPIDLDRARALRRAYREPLAARASYSMGCTFATLSTHPPAPAGDARAELIALAVENLRVAMALAQVREWIDKDPQLDAFREVDEYKRAFLPSPRTDFFELAQVAVHADALKGAGFATVEGLHRLGDDPLSATLLGINKLALRAIVDLADLRLSMTDALVERYGVEILTELTDRNRASRRAVAPLKCNSTARAELALNVRTAILKRCRAVDAKGSQAAGTVIAASLESAIREWLSSVAHHARHDGLAAAGPGR